MTESELGVFIVEKSGWNKSLNWKNIKIGKWVCISLSFIYIDFEFWLVPLLYIHAFLSLLVLDSIPYRSCLYYVFLPPCSEKNNNNDKINIIIKKKKNLCSWAYPLKIRPTKKKCFPMYWISLNFISIKLIIS